MQISEKQLPISDQKIMKESSDLLAPRKVIGNLSKSTNALNVTKSNVDGVRITTKDDLLTKQDIFQLTTKDISPNVPARSVASLESKSEQDNENNYPVLIFEEGQKFRAVQSYHGQDSDELSFQADDLIILSSSALSNEYWLSGFVVGGNQKVGFFPLEFVKAHESRENLQVTQGQRVISTYPYERMKRDELSFDAGITILVLECPDGGWWKGRKDVDGETGWFPSNYVKFVEAEKQQFEGLSVTLAPKASEEEMKFFDTEKGYFATNNSQKDGSEDSPIVDEVQVKGRKFSSGSRQSVMSFAGSSKLGLDVIMQGASGERIQDRISPSVYKILTEKEKRRLAVIWELLETERDFVKDLAIVAESFLKPMSSLTSIGPKNSQLIFSNIEQILSVNSEFLNQLIQLELSSENISAYVEVFLNMTDRFLCYIPFCSNHLSTKTIKSLMSKNDFKEFLQETYKNPLLRQFDLSSFLLKPVQRICKYPLLLRELIKNTASDDSDMTILTKALEKIQNLVLTINECAKRNGNKTVVDVQNRFSEKINISSQNRFFVREDTILVIFNERKKNRILFLFNDLLILGRKDWRDRLHVIEKAGIRDCKVNDINESAGDCSLLLELEILQSNRYVISFQAEVEKQNWLAAYKILVKHQVRSKNIEDVAMTSTDADFDDDDLVHSPEDNIKTVNIKIAGLEKMITEKDSIIKILEEKVLLQREECQISIDTLKLENEMLKQQLSNLKLSEELLQRKLNDSSIKISEQEVTAELKENTISKFKAQLENEIEKNNHMKKSFVELESNFDGVIKKNSDLYNRLSSKVVAIGRSIGIESSLLSDQSLMELLDNIYQESKSFEALKQQSLDQEKSLVRKNSALSKVIDDCTVLLHEKDKQIQDLMWQVERRDSQDSAISTLIDRSIEMKEAFKEIRKAQDLLKDSLQQQQKVEQVDKLNFHSKKLEKALSHQARVISSLKLTLVEISRLVSVDTSLSENLASLKATEIETQGLIEILCAVNRLQLEKRSFYQQIKEYEINLDKSKLDRSFLASENRLLIEQNSRFQTENTALRQDILILMSSLAKEKIPV